MVLIRNPSPVAPPRVEARTPVDVWAPAFHWLSPEHFTPAELLHQVSSGEDAHYCKLCEAVISFFEREQHAREHRRQAAAFRRRRHESATRLAASRLRRLNRERRLTRRMLGGSA